QLITADIGNKKILNDFFTRDRPDAVFHFAGLKAVAESVANPLRYFSVNVGGSINLFETMQQHGVKDCIFSSSATVYGHPNFLPITESHPLAPINPYGTSKMMVEQLLENICRYHSDWRVVALRYFNPCGAHDSGLIGESPLGKPNNLMPLLLQVAGGERAELTIYGDDYATPDGTGVRDYIHVVDLVAAHLAAFQYLEKRGGYSVFNLGRGIGYSVREMVKVFGETIGRPISHKMAARRPGDSAAIWADPGHAEKILGWRATRDLPAMCADSWRFYQYSKKL
ncbi:MAG: UDP-glucose 4-epimerase GalE, partial [Alphaproteobacteria bacterium]|nr:UDP-glucose 4-epimerase GalE [Alphaproteobacteria bacterium]